MTLTVAVIDYGSGNLRSAAKALDRAAADAGLAMRIAVTADAAAVRDAARIVLPGVGAFADCRAGVDAVPGLMAALEGAVRARGVPFLGICVGMQLMATRGLEHGEHAGFGWIPGTVARLSPADPALKVPHMGWNTLRAHHPHPVLPPEPAAPHAYFVHSYALTADDPADIVASADYGGPVTAMVARGNLVGTQFHPEKSQAFGLALLARFLAWAP